MSTGLSLLPVNCTIPVFYKVFETQSDILRQGLSALDALRAAYPESTPSSVKATYMSPWKSHLLNDDLRDVCDQIRAESEHACQQHLNVSLQELDAKLVVTDCWCVDYAEGDFTVPHHHFPTTLSAVLYLSVEKDSAPIYFGGTVSVQPKSGALVIFPGILTHSVPVNKSPRKVIALNMFALSGAQ
jgi:hypothetical protein